MNDKWGFGIQHDRQINYDANDRSIAEYVTKHEPSFNLCIACGTCTATCTAGNLTNFNIRKLQMLIRRGEVTNLREEISKCMFCGKCQMACPRGVNTRNVIHLIKKATEEICPKH